MKDINYPAPQGEYKVDVLNGCDWKGYKHVLLGISLGSKNHAGQKLFALIEWASHRFETTTILVADSLQRHNIMLATGCDEQEALHQSLQMGDLWIKQNQHLFDMLPQYNLHRIDNFKKDALFDRTFSTVQNLFNNNDLFKSIVETDIKSFWLRRGMEMTQQGITYDQFYNSSKNYILEELGVMCVVATQYPGVEAYPGKFLNILKNPLRLQIPELPEVLKKYALIEVDYTKNKGVIFGQKFKSNQ